VARRGAAVALLGVSLIGGLTAAASTRSSTPHPFTIRKLAGSLTKIGSLGFGGDRSPLYGVRIRATVCFQSAAETGSYPDEIDVTHYSVSRSKKTWWAARTAKDRAPWLVPFGETWHGKRCGPVYVEDPIPSVHYGVESLGRACYGVRLTIVVGKRRATKRALFTCHPFS